MKGGKTLKKAVAFFAAVLMLCGCLPFYAFAGEGLYSCTAQAYQDGFLGEVKGLENLCVPSSNGNSARLSTLYVSYKGAVEALAKAMRSPAQSSANLSSYRVSCDETTVGALLSLTLNENPDLFYVDGTIRYNASGGYLSTVYWSWKDGYTRSNVIESQNKFYSAAQNIVERYTTDEMTDVEKALALHDWLGSNVNYEAGAANAHNAYGAVVGKAAVCQGIALAYNYLMGLCGVTSEFVSSADMCHAWNMVNIDSKWYHVDVTWDDPVVLPYNSSLRGNVSHSYFLLSDSKISSGSNPHYGWVVNCVNDGDSGFYTPIASSVAYDGYWWRSVSSDMVYRDGYWYYLSGSNIRKCKTNGLLDSLVLSASAVSLDGDGDRLYYSTPSQIYTYSFENRTTRLITALSVSTVSGVTYDGTDMEYIYTSGNSVYSASFKFDYDYQYTKSGNEVTITKYTGDGGYVTVPSVIDGAEVVGFKEDAFKGNESIVSLSFPSTVSSAGVALKSFDGCNNLLSLDFADKGKAKLKLGDYYAEINFLSKTASVSYIGFDSDIQVPDKFFGKRVTQIAENGFKGNSAVVSVTLPSSVGTIGEYAFANCGKLQTVALPSGVTTIGDYAFYNCTKLANVNLPESLKTIGARAFAFTAFGSVKLPSKVEDNYTEQTAPFYSAVDEVTVGNFVYSIKLNKATFSKYLGSMSSVTVPSIVLGFPVVAIGDGAFEGNTAVEKIVIPESVLSIGERAFSGCTSLKDVNLPQGLNYIGALAFEQTAVNSVALCDSLVSVGHTVVGTVNCGPFANSNIANVTFEGDFVIPAYLFAGCTALQSVDLSNVYSVSAYAFADCSNLAEIVLTEGLNNIGQFAFLNCTSLNAVVLPQSLKMLYSQAFENCTALTSINVPKNTVVTAAKDLPLLSPFNNCSALASAELADGIEAVPSYLFYGCSALSSVNIPSSVKDIGAYAFYSTALTAVELPNGVIHIEKFAFADCGSLSQAVLPSTLYSLGAMAFSGTALTGVNIPSSLKVCNAVADGETLKGPFAECGKLAAVSFDSGVERVISNLFADCDGLAQIKFPYTVNFIEPDAFACCDGLKAVYLGEGLINVNSGAFSLSALEKDGDSVIYYAPNSYAQTFAEAYASLNACTAEPAEKSRFAPSGASNLYFYSYSKDLADLTLGAEITAVSEDYSSAFSNGQTLNITGCQGEYIGVVFALPEGANENNIAVWNVTEGRLVAAQVVYDETLGCKAAVFGVCGDASVIVGVPSVVKGKLVDGEAEITMQDAMAVYGFVSSSERLTAAQTLAADMNGDGKVNLLDVLYILLIMAKG